VRASQKQGDGTSKWTTCVKWDVKVRRRSEKRRSRLLCLALAFSIFLGLSFPSSAEAVSRASRDKAAIPLVLISEPVKGGLNDEKDSLWVKSGLVSKLKPLGYEVGRNLFIYTPDAPFGDLTSGAQAINSQLGKVLSSTGSSKVNVAGYGVSGSVFRIGLEMGIIQDGMVENAILLTAPQRGSFMAGNLFGTCEVIKQEIIFERDTRGARFSPFGSIGEPLDGNLIPANSAGDLPSSIGSGKFSWESETYWVGKRASELYEPLYAEYVKTRYLSLPYIPTDSPKQTFPGWIKANRPLIWENCVVTKEVPPFGVYGQAKTALSSPQRGEDFTIAYYEVLAMDVAKNQYVVRQASKGSLAKSLFSGTYVPIDWKDALLYYGGKALVHYGKKALITAKAEVQKLVMDNIVKSIDYLDSAEDAFLRRLVKENVLVNLGTSVGERFFRLKANYYLESINNESQSKARERKTRYVTITSKISNLAGTIWPGTGPNNLFCEVDCAVPPQGPRDIVRVVSGMFSPSYLDLMKNKKVQQTVISVLSQDFEKQEISLKDGQKKDVKVSSWEPGYITGVWKKPQHQCFQISIDLPLPPEGWGYSIWLEGNDGTGWMLIPGSSQVINAGKNVEVILKNPSHRVGIRLVRLGPVNPFTPGGRVDSVFEKEVTHKVKVSASSMDTTSSDQDSNWPQLGSPSAANPGTDPYQWGGSSWEGSQGQKGAGGQPSIGGQTSQEGQSGTGGQAGSGVSSGNQGTPNASGSDPEREPKGSYDDEYFGSAVSETSETPTEIDGIPCVRVVYRNKHTTLWEAKETYHSYWEVDFGDGESAVISGQPDLLVSHVFQGPGSYNVDIVSYDNYGKMLLRKSFKVDVSSYTAQTHQFRCRSIVAPKVHLEISGPKKWVTGKYALFTGEVSWHLPQDAEVVNVTCDPGEKFYVIWERSGEFTVYWAVALTIDYDIDGQFIQVKNTYVESVSVDIFTPGITK